MGAIERRPVSEQMTWPDEHLTWQGVIDAIPTHSVPFAVHVFLFDTRAHMQAACQVDNAAAHSSSYDEPDTNNIGALMFFNTEDLELSLAAHEATHVALHHASVIETTRVGARRWLNEHPEWVAEMIGNLTILVWSALIENRGDR